MSAVFIHRLRVTYADCTLGNHVYYGRYLDFLEATRGEFFRQLGRTFLQWREAGAIFPVLEVQVRYRGAARYEAETHHVCTNLSDKPQRLPQDLISALAPYRRSDAAA